MQGKPTYSQEECFRFRDRVKFLEDAWSDEQRDHLKTMDQRASAFLRAAAAEDKAAAAIRSLSQCAARLATYKAALRLTDRALKTTGVSNGAIREAQEAIRKALEDNT